MKIDKYIPPIENRNNMIRLDFNENCYGCSKKIQNTSNISMYPEYNTLLKKISELRISDEGQEGINAFLEKRKPTWRG